jgi:hypothetical protein
MTKTATTLATAVLLAMSLPAFAGSCPMDIKQIDAALAANPALSADDLERVRELRAEGEQLHKSGKHADSVARLGEAKQLLGI